MYIHTKYGACATKYTISLKYQPNSATEETLPTKGFSKEII